MAEEKSDSAKIPSQLSKQDILKFLSKPVKEDPALKEHKFWDTQPVPRLTDVVDQIGPMEMKTLEQVQKDPYNLPPGFEWVLCDMKDQKTVKVFLILFCVM